MTRLGILVLLAAFVATGCTTRRGGKIGMGVGMGLALVGGGLIAAGGSDDSNGNQVSPPASVFIGGPLLISGLITAGLSAIVVGAAPDPNELPPPPPPLPPQVDQLARAQRVAAFLARSGHCDQVREINVQVVQQDPAFHAAKFSRDSDIAKCLAAN